MPLRCAKCGQTHLSTWPCRWKLCEECGQPMKPKGVRKKPNEFDHASGCSLAPKKRAKAQKPGEQKA